MSKCVFCDNIVYTDENNLFHCINGHVYDEITLINKVINLLVPYYNPPYLFKEKISGDKKYRYGYKHNPWTGKNKKTKGGKK